MNFHVSDLDDPCNKMRKVIVMNILMPCSALKHPTKLSGSFTKITPTSRFKIWLMHHLQNFDPIEFSLVQGVAVPPTMASRSAWAFSAAPLKNITNIK